MQPPAQHGQLLLPGLRGGKSEQPARLRGRQSWASRVWRRTLPIYPYARLTGNPPTPLPAQNSTAT